MNFTFTDQQISYIMQALALRPLGEALELWNEIQRQAAVQSGQARPVGVPDAPQPARKPRAPRAPRARKPAAVAVDPPRTADSASGA